MIDLMILLACAIIVECVKQKMNKKNYDQVERKLREDVRRWIKYDNNDQQQ